MGTTLPSVGFLLSEVKCRSREAVVVVRKRGRGQRRVCDRSRCHTMARLSMRVRLVALRARANARHPTSSARPRRPGASICAPRTESGNREFAGAVGTQTGRA